MPNLKSANKSIGLMQKIVKYFALFFLLFGLLIIIISIFSSAKNKVLNLESNSVSGWKEHKNEYMGISLRYPDDWELNTLGESAKFEDIILESPCDTQKDTQCATVSFYPRKAGVDSVPSYDPDMISNETTLNIDGVVVNAFDFDYSPINSLEKIYQFEHNNIIYDVIYFETPYINGEAGDPKKLIYAEEVNQIIKSLNFAK